MNDKILNILRKNGLVFHNEDTEIYKHLNSAIIEICEEQILQCYYENSIKIKLHILNSKNIAE